MLQHTEEQKKIPKGIIMQFYHHSKTQLQLLFKYLYYDTEVLEKFLVVAKENVVDKVTKEFSKWENGLPPYSEKFVFLIQEGEYETLKLFLNEKISVEELMKYEYNQEIQQIDGEIEQSFDQRPLIVQDALIFNIPHHLIKQFVDYLDPFSLAIFRQTCKEFSEIKYDSLYKKFIKILYSIKPTQVPQSSPFLSIAEYVNTNANLYSADIINQVQILIQFKLINDDARGQVWSDIPEYQEIVNKEYSLKLIGKKFQSFQECFLKAPRINYCGIYAVQEKYIKIGEATMNRDYAPMITVESYRYVRFWPQGVVTMLVSTKKLDKSNMIKYFSEFEPVTDQQTNNLGPYMQTPQEKIHSKLIRGEFIIDYDHVIMKTFTSTTIFTFIFQIISTERCLSNYLFLESAHMRIIGESYHYDLKKTHNMKYFKYKHMKEFRNNLMDLGNNWNKVTY